MKTRGTGSDATFRKPAVLSVLAALLVMSMLPGLHAEQFQKVKMLVAGTEKTSEMEVILSLEDAQLVVLSKESLNQMKSLNYKDIKSAEYSFSKTPKWKSGSVADATISVLSMPVNVFKGKQHWLKVRTANDYAVLQLEKNDYRLIITAFETRSGVKVEILPEEK
jgi:hypothetical protein